MQKRAGLPRHLADRLRAATAESTQRRRMASVFAVGLAVMLGYHAFFGTNGVFAYQSKRAEHHLLTRQIAGMENENARLKQHVEHLRSDPDAIAYEAHTRLRYTRAGEVILLNSEPGSHHSGTAAQK